MNRRSLLKAVALLPFMPAAIAAVAEATEAKQYRTLIIYRGGKFLTKQPFSAAKTGDIIWIISTDYEHGKCYEVGGPPVFIDRESGYGFPVHSKPHMDCPPEKMNEKQNHPTPV